MKKIIIIFTALMIFTMLLGCSSSFKALPSYVAEQFPTSSPAISNESSLYSGALESCAVTLLPENGDTIKCAGNAVAILHKVSSDHYMWKGLLTQGKNGTCYEIELTGKNAGEEKASQENSSRSRVNYAIYVEGVLKSQGILDNYVDDFTAFQPVFEDVNMDGYADLVLLDYGGLNTWHNFYVWDAETTSLKKVNLHGANNSALTISYYEIQDGYISNWIKNSIDELCYQEYVWVDGYTIKLEREELLILETDDM